VGGLSYGLPYFVHPDESLLVPIAMGVLAGDPNPHFFNWPSLYMYVLAGVFAAYGLVLRLTEGVSVVAAFVRDPVPFYLLGRVVTATLGTLTVGLCYRLGARLYGPGVGVAAGLFLAVNLQHVVDSHFATADVPVTCLVLAAMLATVGYWERGRLSTALLAGVLGGLAASAKYNGALVGAAFLVAHALRWRTSGASWPGLITGRVLPVWLGGAVVGFLVGTPFAALAPGEFLRGLFGEVRAIGTVQFGNEGDLPGLAFHLFHSLPQAMGAASLLCAGAGLAVALWRRGPADLILLAFPLPYLGIIATWDSRFERYTVPLLPLVSILAAVGVATVASRVGRRRGLVFATLAVLVAAPAAARVLYFEILLARPDSREVAGQWMERSLPASSRVAMEPYSPPVSWTDAAGRVQRVTSPPLGSPPTGLAPKLPRPRPAPWVSGLRIAPLVEYDFEALRARGMTYVVLSSFMYKRHTGACASFPAACRFYRDLDARATLVYAIEPIPEDRRLWMGDIYAPVSDVFARTRPGPIIKIYRLPGA
jgi:hypothetical protein